MFIFFLLPFTFGYIRNLTWNDINFIHTTDTHGWYSGHLNQKQYNANWGDFISFTHHLKNKAHFQNQDFLLIDSGDRHDGNGLSDITQPNGLYSTPIFIKQDYDLLTIGNHELYLFENSKQEFETVATHFKDKYITSNVEFWDGDEYVPFGQKYKYFRLPKTGKNVLAFGFLFDFKRFDNGTRVIPMLKVAEEQWFKDVLVKYQDKVDLIIVVGHTPISHEWPEFYQLHHVLRKYYPNTIVQYFGGHSHIRDFTIFDDRSTGLQSGRYCETAGWISINTTGETVYDRFARSYIDFNLDSFKHHTTKDFDTEKGLAVSILIKDTRKYLNLNKPIGYVKSNYYVDYVPIDSPKNIFNLLSNKVLKTLPGDDEERIIIINTGSIRYDLYKGPYTIDSQYIVSPFENEWVNITIPKSVAVKVAQKLNEAKYIMLSPPQQWLKKPSFEKRQVVLSKGLSKGYVTHDDFGSDGDDTPHKAVINFPIPNVIESIELENESDVPVNLVFYDFITPNILWALKELDYQIESSPSSYSHIYLGELLNNYISKLQ
ncbi:unnamed protein product [Candida verbasci]|uniref:Calcineurin-like phosphoesterase domain-containing protein n=1 Tax=Candida verbasci TaxID=1227364 RepID=A0A9W4TYW1_9ASCO|nr:unnamed protein product [Candida verbasci]